MINASSLLINMNNGLMDVKEVTPLEFYEMDCFEKFNVQMAMLQREALGLLNFKEWLTKLTVKTVNYKYKYIKDDTYVYFIDSRDVTKYFGMGMQKVWRLVRESEIINFEKIDETHIFDSNGNLLKVI